MIRAECPAIRAISARRSPVQTRFDSPHTPLIEVRRFLGSIAFRVLALLIGALVLPVALNVFLATIELRWAESRIQAETQNVATNSANSVADVVEEFVGAAQVIERLSAYWEGTDQDRDQLLTFLGAAHPGFATLRFYTNDLEQHGSSHSDSQSGKRESAANSDFARQATATGRIAFTSTPVLDSGIGLRETGNRLGGVTEHGVHSSRAVLHDLGVAADIARKGVPAPIQAGRRWVIERTHAWMNGYGKLRRCTEKRQAIVDFYLFLAAAFVTVRCLIREARIRYRWRARPTTRRLK